MTISTFSSLLLVVLAVCSSIAVQGFALKSSSVVKVRHSMVTKLAAAAAPHRASSLKINMEGKTVFVGGVADSSGYGWAITKACADAGT
jgi:enoyl-[acyl-carrier protein] reductase I